MADELRLSIEKLIYGGDGLAHADGNTIFVPFVLPGEGVRANAKSKKKKLIWTELLEVTSPAKERGKAKCAHFQKCGGCHYQHIPAAEQLRHKKDILRETLLRLGGITWDGEVVEHSAEPYGYRNRAQWAVRSGMPRALGYFLPESSVIVPIDECPVLSPRLAHTFAQLQEMARSGRLPEGIQEIEAFADSADEKIALNVAFQKFPKPAAELASAFREALPEIESLLLLDQKKNRFELTGPGFLTHEAGGYKYRVSHLSFFQVNRFLIEDLLKTVTANAHGALALDLYSGVGFFTLPLAKTFQKVVSVDANLAATRDLYANAEIAGVTITSHNDHAEEFLKMTEERPEFVVLDPPRAGLGAEAAERLAELGAKEIVYLSCDPSTLARDLAVLTGSPRKPKELTGPNIRYEITEMHAFDLFPQTFHIETLVRLRKVP
jgi:23S rRNA (uracil1939-C5)-methyltransferase